MKHLISKTYLLISLLLILNACSSSDKELLSPENSILEFAIGNKKATISEEEKTIALELPYDADLTKAKPALIISSGATVSPTSGTEVNFTNPVSYKVLAENGDPKTYTVAITKEKSPVAQITAFTFMIGESKVEATIDNETKKITALAPFGSDLTKVIPAIAYTGASIDHEAGKALDLTKEQKVTVTAENGNKMPYTINVTVAASNVANILTFAFNALTPKVVATIDGTTITATVPFETDWTKLVPTITIKGKEISPKTDVAQDFSKDVLYTVTADNAEKVVYTVKVTRTASAEAELIKFAFNGLNPKVEGVLNPDTKIVTASVPFETDLTKLVPTIEFKGREIKPISGDIQNFGVQVNYTITAQDANTIYRFGVVVSKDPFLTQVNKIDKQKVIRGSVITITGKFAAKGNYAELVNGTLKSELTIISENATTIVAKIGDMAKLDYHNVRVKANGVSADSKEQIQVLAEHQMASTFTKFYFQMNTTSSNIIQDNGEIEVVVRYGTDITKLRVTNSSVEFGQYPPVKIEPDLYNMERDYTNPVKYTLTSAEGAKKEYTVKVTEGKFPININDLNKHSYVQRSTIFIRGALGASGNVVELVDAQGTKYYPTISDESTASFGAYVGDNIPAGEYTMFVSANNARVEYTKSKITITPSYKPEFSYVENATVSRDGNLTIHGKFQSSGNKLYIVAAGDDNDIVETLLEVVSENENIVVAKIGKQQRDQEYTLRLKAVGYIIDYQYPIIVKNASKATIKINETVYSKTGDYVIITAQTGDLDQMSNLFVYDKSNSKLVYDGVAHANSSAIYLKLKDLTVGKFRMNLLSYNSYSTNFVEFEVTE